MEDIKIDSDDFGFGDNKGKTIADYTNFRNILFQYSQQFNAAVVNFKFNNNKSYYEQAVKDYMFMYYQLNETKRLKHITKPQREYMAYFYNHTNLINLKVLMKLNMLILEIMNKYGVYDISKKNEMYR